MNNSHLIFCLALICTILVSCDFPDYTNEINAAYFNAGGGSSSNAECTYGKYRCSSGNSQFCAYSGNDLSWQLSETCSYGCDSSTGKCKSASGSGSGSNSGGNNSGDSENNQNNDPTDTGTEEPTQSACYPNPCENLANSTGTCTTTPNGEYFCGCNDGYNWRRKECVIIPKVLGNICTGKTKCYTDSDIINCNSSSIGDYYGQDAHYAAQDTCIQKKFMIDDSVPEEKTVIDENLRLEWQQTIPMDKYKWNDAIKYCEELAYGGHDDWRLPTVKELVSIVDKGNEDLTIDTISFPGTPPSNFWALSEYLGSSSYAWRIGFCSSCGVGKDPTYDTQYVRCVRGEILPDLSSFNSSSKNGDEIITDSKTGLIWQGNYESGKVWREALSYCENLTYAGYSDWRLPNTNELISLINYEEIYPASDFPDMPNNGFWSSDPVYSLDAWYADFEIGGIYETKKTEPYYADAVRCVR